MKINLFGYDLTLYERTARDVMDMTEFMVRNNESSDVGIYIFQSAKVVESSIRNNIKYIPWWKFLKRINLSRKLSVNYLLGNLSPGRLAEIAKQVYEVEGLVDDGKKKVKAEA